MSGRTERPGVHEDWTKLISANEVEPGRGRFVRVGPHELAVFHLSDPDHFVVVQNACPHAGGNLSAGRIDDGIVTCPWHEWSFDLDRQRCTESKCVTLRGYECKVEEGILYARLNALPPHEPS